MHQKFSTLYEEYNNGLLDRRKFFKQLAVLYGGTATAYTLLSQLATKAVSAEVIPKDDPRLHTETVLYPGQTGDVRAYWARPKGKDELPAVIVIHENRGLNDHIKDVTRRMALEGFLAIAPDALSPIGGTPKDSNEARSRLRELDYQDTIKNFAAAVQYLKTHPLST